MDYENLAIVCAGISALYLAGECFVPSIRNYCSRMFGNDRKNSYPDLMEKDE